ncbi:cyclodehydratase [Mycobacterium sp.]|uniref:cyclodehydratase n=1 Tax=Mycobacterium sp. TaxID=1785 RepID=UPI001285FE25|nr:cyclodehydratase [Mycobacterium sp.]KAA8958157.1 MAG: cyclodehydratase [Mycobacterium sp.]
MPVLVRPEGTVQIGWSPHRAVVVHPPRGLTATALAGLLRSLHTPTSMPDLQRQSGRCGLVDVGELGALLAALVDVGVATGDRPRRHSRSPSIRVHGRGPLSDLLAEALRCSGARIKRSSQPHAVTTVAGTDLVVLSDYLVADPRMVRELRSHGVPHLPVRVRDGAGLVGPLVIPGVTSCLDCADLHRRDRDAAWPVVAAQLRDTVGTADRATLMATTALALSQVDRVIGAVTGSPTPDHGPPPALNATLEFDIHAGSILARQWTKHPLCSC